MAASMPETARGEAGEPRRNPPGSGIAGPLALIVFAAVLYVAKDIFVPLAMAALLSFVLSPPMLWLRHHHIGRAPAAIAVVVLAFVAIGGFGSVVVEDVGSLSKNLPTYERNVAGKLRALEGAIPLQELVQRGTRILEEFSGELARPGGPGLAPGGAPPPQIVQLAPRYGVGTILEDYVGPVVKPLAAAGLVLIFTIFFLFNREDLRDRFIRLAGADDLHRTTQMLDDAVGRLSRYLWVELVINAGYGAVIALGTFAIGIPNAALWGVLALVLRFVPYIGTWVAAFFPVLLSLAVAPGWSMFAEVVGLWIVVEIATANFVEPLLYGASAGLSPVAVLVAAAFWTWLWGPIGLVLSTPLTACLVVIGHYARPLRFLAVLLGAEQPLTAEESFYQRLLATDAAEAAEQAASFAKSHSLAGFYEQVALPALALAQDDSDRGVVARETRAQIRDSIRGMIESLADEPPRRRQPGARAVYCLGARNEIDEAAALLLAQLLLERGVAAHAGLAQSWIATTRDGAPAEAPILCVSALGDASLARARLLLRRLRRQAGPEATIALGHWLKAAPTGDAGEAAAIGADFTAAALGEAAARIAALAGGADAAGAEQTVDNSLAEGDKPR